MVNVLWLTETVLDRLQVSQKRSNRKEEHTSRTRRVEGKDQNRSHLIHGLLTDLPLCFGATPFTFLL